MAVEAPETHRRAEVEKFLKKASYFSIFSVPNSELPNQPVGLLPGMRSLITAVEVNESLHRFDINVGPAANHTGEQVARVHIHWALTPDGYEPAPGEYPPRTLLVPFVSQQFCTLDGELRFLDREGSGFRGFGFGRTFPGRFGDPLKLGAVIDVMEGLGACRGLVGTAVVNGTVRPPSDLALNIMVRFMDPAGRLRASTHSPLSSAALDADPAALFMVMLGEVDPSRPVQLDTRPDGTIAGSSVFERLRLVHLASGATATTPPRMSLREGPIIGSVTARLMFNPFAPSRISAIATTDGVFSFHTPGGASIGEIAANMVDGRAFRENVAGLPAPIFRFGGFGPVLGGSGAFGGATGMMTMNAAVSVFPRTLSNMYILRLDDPDGRYRAGWAHAWSR